MRLFGAKKVVPFTEADANAEALRAARLIEEATAGSLTTAVEKLGEFSKLVEASPQKEIYDLDAVQEVLGRQVVTYIEKNSPEYFHLRLPINIGGGSEPPLRLEAAVDQAIFVFQEAANGLMDKPKVKKNALGICREILWRGYQSLLQSGARTALKNEGDVSYDFEALIEAYEQICTNYQQDVGRIAIPTIEFEQRGERSERTARVVYDEKKRPYLQFEREVIKRNTTRVLYRAAVNHTLSHIERALAEEDEILASDYGAQVIETALAKIKNYSANAELQEEEKQKLATQIDTFRKSREEIADKISGAICKKQDELYEAIETQAEAGNYEAAVEGIGALAEYTARFTRVLEETADEARSRAKNEILRPYFE